MLEYHARAAGAIFTETIALRVRVQQGSQSS
jgi:hypothetical protein